MVRVADPRTGVSRPRWVGRFPTEGAAKSARDEARRRARRGEYVDRSSITVAAYLGQWLAAHSLETKPKTLAGYRWLVDRYVIPRMGAVRLQAVRPNDLSTLYRGAGGPRPPRVGIVHATANAVGTLIFIGSWAARSRERHDLGVRLGRSGGMVLMVGGAMLGGYMRSNRPIIGLFKAECIRTTVFHDGPYKTLADVEYAATGWVD